MRLSADRCPDWVSGSCTLSVALKSGVALGIAFLTIEDGKYYAVHRGRKLELPADGGSVLEYLGSAAALEPANSKLRQAVGRARP